MMPRELIYIFYSMGSTKILQINWFTSYRFHTFSFEILV